MTIVNYRQFAVEIVRDVCKLLNRSGSCHAFRLAQTWANGNAEIGALAHNARDAAERDARRILDEPRNGGFEAASAAWLLLEEDISPHVEEIIVWVAMAKAARYAFERHGTQIGAIVEAEFDYIRSIEIELMRGRLARFEAEWHGYAEDELDSRIEEFKHSHSGGQGKGARGLLNLDAEIGNCIRFPWSESAMRA